MKKCIKNLIDEIDAHDNINSKSILVKFKKKIKIEIIKSILLYGDNGGLDDYALNDIDYVVLYYIWKRVDRFVKLEEILVIIYAFYKLEEFHFNPDVFYMSRIMYILNNSNINSLIINVLYIINE